MADPFWDPIFARLSQNIDLVRQMALDTSDSVLVPLVGKHPVLKRRTTPFCQKKAIRDKTAFVEVLMAAAAQEEALRQVLFYGWITRNPKTLEFPTLPITEQSLARLHAGEFGSPEKIVILAQIDPRESAKSLYEAFRREATVPHPDQVAEALVELESQRELLEHELTFLRNELKEMRKKHKTLDDQNRELENRLSRKTQETLSSEQNIFCLKEEIHRLQQRIEAGAPEKIALAPATLPEPVQQECHDCPGYRQRIHDLEAALERKDQTMTRLRREQEDLRLERDRNREYDDSRQRLQKSHQELSRQYNTLLKARVGRLIARGRHPDTTEPFGIGEFISGEKRVLEGEPFFAAGLIENEWFSARFNEQDELLTITSLETDFRQTLTGYLEKTESGWVLVTPQQSVPVFCEVCADDERRIASGQWLPMFADRPEGIFQMKFHEATSAGAARTFMSWDSIRAFFRLDHGTPEDFSALLTRHRLPCTSSPAGIECTQDARAILQGLRPHLSISVACEAPACRKKAARAPFRRCPQPSEACSFCGTITGEALPEGFRPMNFGDDRILIAGGDAVGSQYQRVFAAHHLDVTWISGFGHLGGLRANLQGFRLIVLILKQISHTLLREILLGTQGSITPVLYCPHRGISGVLQAIQAHYHKGAPR
jgi:hypothetical protein